MSEIEHELVIYCPKCGVKEALALPLNINNVMFQIGGIQVKHMIDSVCREEMHFGLVDIDNQEKVPQTPVSDSDSIINELSRAIVMTDSLENLKDRIMKIIEKLQPK